MKSKRKGFTLVEMLAVVAVILILAGISTTAVSSMIKSAREHRSGVMQMAFEQALAAYYAQNGEWPSVVETKSENMQENEVLLTHSETDNVLQEVVKCCFGKGRGIKSQLLDCSGLFVCSKSRAESSRAYGIDFADAVNKNSKHYLSITDMAFGYPETDSGKFRRYHLIYNASTDSMHVRLATDVSSRCQECR